jgi:ACT domain-containing protein
MDNQCLVLLSKFSVAARKVIGSINSAKLIRDSQYAKEIFQQVDEMGDEELILLSLDLQNTLGLLTSTLTDTASVVEKKYVYGARG